MVRRAPQLGLTPALVAESYRRARSRLAAFLEDDADADALWAELRGDLAGAPDVLSPEALLRRFFGAATALPAHARHPALARGEIRDLTEVMAAVLRLAGGERGDTAVAFLQVAFHEALAALAAAEGRAADAAWRHLAAFQAGQTVVAELDAAFFTALARRLLRVGSLGAAGQALAAATAAPGAGEPSATRALALARVEQAILERQLEAGGAALVEAQGAFSEARLAFAQSVLAASGGDLSQLAGVVRRHGQSLGPAELFESILWLRAPRQRELMLRAPSLPAVARRHRGQIAGTPSLKALHEIVQAVVGMYETERPLPARGEALLAALAGRDRVPTLTQELLALAAGARALARHTQHALLPVVVEPYRAVSLALTEGADPDALGLAADLLDHRLLSVRALPEDTGVSDGDEGAVPTRGRRLTALASMTGKVGIKLIGAKMRLAVAGKERAQVVRARNAARIAEALAAEMRGLRGVVQKLGQTLSFATALMPDEARAVLGALCTTATPLSVAAARSAAERGLGRPPAEAFAEFAPEPMAAGSIGQVHAAALGDGRRVAVKIQYPGIAGAIADDFRSASFLAGLVKRQLPHANVDEVLAEVEKTLLTECDYVQEAEHQRLARDLCADLPGIVIPQVHSALSSATVLTTDFLAGESFDSFCAVATQGERDEIGRLMFTFIMRSALRDGLFYGDPQPGNFLILAGDDGVKLGVIDFGCVGRWAVETRAVFGAFYRIHVEPPSGVDFGALLRRAGFVADPAKFDYVEERRRQEEGIMRPFLLDEPFTFTEQFTLDVARTTTRDNKNLTAGALPATMVLTTRLIWGLYFLLGRLGATANWRRLMIEILADTAKLAA